MNIFENINTLIGSKNISRYSHGNIYPIVAVPFGMVNFSIQNKNDRWFYDPDSHSFEGLRLTHQPSPWMGDYGHLLFLPITGEVNDVYGMRWSSYRPKETTFKPYLLEGYLQRYEVEFKLTTTTRGAFLSLESQNELNCGLAIMPYETANLEVGLNEVKGYITTKTCWGEKSLNEYFYIKTSSEIIGFNKDKNGGLVLEFKDKLVDLTIATSFVSVKQAELNYKQELTGKTFNEVMEENKNLWLSYLEEIEVSNENPLRTKTFYSCFYRALLFPRVFHEFNEEGKAVHYNADTKKVHEGVFYTDNGFWDTYRTVYPFLSIIRPELVKEMLEGFINFSEETGALPRWINPAEHGLMPGTLVEAVFADATVKGILKGELLERAHKVLLKSAYTSYDTKYQGRIGLKDYLKYGYVPNDIKESINNTCDDAYGDFCIAQVCKACNDEENYEKLMLRSKNYQNLFDKETGFLRGKDREGNFKKEFDPYRWGDENCEGSYWQNSFAVYHDILGLADLYGGVKELEKKIDSLFAAKPIYHIGGYAEEIHEMSEMASVDFGQCAISNQPSFHIPYIYSAIGNREKTCYWVERLVNEAFNSSTEGFPGDEDNGTMACWYIFSCLGFYPFCPGKNEFVASKPLFKEIKIKGKKLCNPETNIFKLEI